MSAGLFDRDVFLKLACVDLWEETLDALVITRPYRLASTSNAASSERLLRRRCMPDDVFDGASERLKKMVATVPVLPGSWLADAQRTDVFNKLITITDAGEAGLTAIALEVDLSAVVITGDKRHVNILQAELPQEASRLKGRLLTFEDCLSACRLKHGFGLVLSKAVPAVKCDGMLGLALSSGAATTEQHFIDALRSFNA